MMTSKEIQTLIDNILVQVNQAFSMKDKEIEDLKRRVEVLEKPKIGRPKKVA